jgi:hypothetical protein
MDVCSDIERHIRRKHLKYENPDSAVAAAANCMTMLSLQPR